MIQRIVALVVILAVVVGGGWFAYQKIFPKEVEATATGPTYATEPVTRGDITVSVDTTGPLRPMGNGALMLPWDPNGQTSYTFDHWNVKEGDQVKAGQVVAVLTAPDLSQTVQQDQQKLDSDLGQLAALLGVSKDQAMQADPSQGVILTAPIAGRVTGLNKQVGNKLDDGVTVAQIVDSDTIVIKANLTPGEGKTAKLGEAVALQFPDYAGTVTGKITSLNSNPVPVDASTLGGCSATNPAASGRVFVYWATIEAKNPGLIAPGMDVTVGLKPDGADSDSTIWTAYCQKIDSYGQQQAVISPTAGIITKIYAEDMEQVQPGDPILALAGQDVQQHISDLKDAVFADRTKLNQDQSKAAQMDIKSPIDGVVANLNQVNPGQTIQSGYYFGQVFNPAQMMLDAQVSDVDVVNVRQGADVTVTVDALPGQTFQGKVQQVATGGTDKNGITQYRVEITVQGGPQMRPGMQGNAHIDAGSAKDTLLVPIEAVFEDNNQPTVEVLNPDGTTTSVPIKVGLMNNRYVQVTDGLKEGQKVIVGSSADILPSQHVNQQGGLLPSTGSEPGGGSGGESGGSSGGGAADGTVVPSVPGR